MKKKILVIFLITVFAIFGISTKSANAVEVTFDNLCGETYSSGVSWWDHDMGLVCTDLNSVDSFELTDNVEPEYEGPYYIPELSIGVTGTYIEYAELFFHGNTDTLYYYTEDITLDYTYDYLPT